MPYQVNEHDKKVRAGKLIELSDKLEEEYYKKHINNLITVLVEEVGKEYSVGHTSNYLKVKIYKNNLEQGGLIEVCIYDYKDKMLIGK